MVPKGRLISRGLAFGLVLALLPSAVPPAFATEPVFVPFGNHRCSEFGGGAAWIPFKIDPPSDGVFTDGALVVTITGFDGHAFDWSSNHGVDAVFVKGGANGNNLYLYAPESTGAQRLAAAGPATAEIGHLDFCYDGANVRVTKSPTTNSVAVGAAYGFNLAVESTGTDTAHDVSLIDELPSVTGGWALGGPDASSCALQDGEIACAFGSLPPGVGRMVSVSATSTTAECAAVTNTAVAGALEDQRPGDSVSTATAVIACPSSSLAKSVRPAGDDEFSSSGSAEPGELVDYRITYRNAGDAAAHGVEVTDAVPAQTRFVSCAPACATAGAPISELTWELGTVPAGESRVLAFVVALDHVFSAGTTELSNTASADSSEEDPVSSNEVVLQVVATPALGVRVTVDTDAAGPGDAFTYTLTYFNAGDGTVESATVAQRISAGTEFVSCTDGCQVGASVAWEVGSVEGGTTLESPAGSVTLTVRVRSTNTDCLLCSQAVIASPQQDAGAPVAAPPLCVDFVPVAQPAGAHASGGSVPLRVSETPIRNDDIDLPNLGATITASVVSSSQTGPGSTVQNRQVFGVNAGTLASFGTINGTSTSAVGGPGPAADQRSTSTLTSVSLLGGVIQARTIHAAAHATADGVSAAADTAGSAIEGLVVAGIAVDAITPGTRIPLPTIPFGSGSYVALMEVSVGTSMPSGTLGGTYAADAGITMLRIHVESTSATRSSFDFTVGAVQAHADFPQTQVC